MDVINAAVAEADRLKHLKVGTQHLALALARSHKLLGELGFTHDCAEAALREVIVDRRMAAQLYDLLGVALGKKTKK